MWALHFCRWTDPNHIESMIVQGYRWGGWNHANIQWKGTQSYKNGMLGITENKKIHTHTCCSYLLIPPHSFPLDRWPTTWMKKWMGEGAEGECQGKSPGRAGGAYAICGSSSPPDLAVKKYTGRSYRRGKCEVKCRGLHDALPISNHSQPSSI